MDLSDLQIQLLKYFKYQTDQQELLDIKKLLSRYFAEKAMDRMDELWQERQWSAETVQSWLEEDNAESSS